MKQKLKGKFNVGDKVKKTSFTKCVKMSKEVENLKNGVLNGDSVINTNHIQQQQPKLNNNNSNADSAKSIVGGRLQFYKDGKFILELARAREGEKTGWISVPRKTFWPPTISTNSSTTFSKHESSTSLSYSDDNSSVQSSPWQRDHCWKQSRPRQNISKEMAFFFFRPEPFNLTDESIKISKIFGRRPPNKVGDCKVKFIRKKAEKEEEVKCKIIHKNVNEDFSSDKSSNKLDNDDKNKEARNNIEEEIDTLDGVNRTSKRESHQKLDTILKKLSDRMASKLGLNGSGSNGTNHYNGHNHHQTSTPYSLASHIANSINSQPHQHVSPRKRILRELEKVTLEDSKRLRPKAILTNGNGSLPAQQISNGAECTNTTGLNGNMKNEKVIPPTSRPISSYSITSLLAHTTSSSSSSTFNKANCANSSILTGRSNISINSNDSSSASHYQHQQQRLSLNSTPPKSPSTMQNKDKSPNTTPPRFYSTNVTSSSSPSTQSPSPEHHAFHKYRPTTTTPSSSSSYSKSYNSPNYMRGSPSPHDRLRTTTTGSHHGQQSAMHFGTSPIQNYNSVVRDSSLSPNFERSESRNTPLSTTATSGIRTVPKKTAALRQQFSSPTMESSNKTSKSVTVATTAQNAKSERLMDVDALLRPSVLIPPPMQALGQPNQLGHYPYMYSSLSYLPTHAVSPYYHPSFYNPAMMAAAAAAYRYPSYPHPAVSTSLPPTVLTSPSLSSTMGSSFLSDRSGHQKSSPVSSSSLSSPPTTALIGSSSPKTTHSLQQHNPPFVHTSPWNSIPIVNHSINDGNNFNSKLKDEQSSDVPLNLSKH